MCPLTSHGFPSNIKKLEFDGNLINKKHFLFTLDQYQGTGLIIHRRPKMEKLSIGELARQANINIDNIRYYERRGL